jgi:hypothetical protein
VAVSLDLWRAADRTVIDAEAERLATFRGLALAAVEVAD